MANQISDYIGKQVIIVMADDSMVLGELRFFNFQDQIIHLKKFNKANIDGIIEEGEFLVINKANWKSIKAKRRNK